MRPKVAAAAIEQEIAGALPGRPKVLLDCLARLLGDLEADRKTGLALPNGRAFDGMDMWVDVLDLQAHQVAATRLAHPYRSVTTFPPKRLRRLARQESDGRGACRLLGLANVLDGMSRERAAC